VFQKTDTLFIFAITLCVVTNLKTIWQYCSKGNLEQNTHFKFHIDGWCLTVTQAENTSSTATVNKNITQQNPTLKFMTQFDMNEKHGKRRSDQVFKICRPLAFTQAYHWKIWSLQRTLENDVTVFVREFGATHSLQQWVLAHDIFSSISTSYSDERYGIPKSGEFLSLMKFDLWFCDSLVHLPDSSIHWQNQRCHQFAHYKVVPFLDTSYCQCFLILLTYSGQEPSNLCQEILLQVFSTIILEFLQIFNKKCDPQHCTPYLHFKRRLLSINSLDGSRPNVIRRQFF